MENYIFPIYRGSNMWNDNNETISLQQLCFLLINCGFKKCELWERSTYAKRYGGSKEYRSDMIASEQIELLHEAGMTYKEAVIQLCLSGEPKYNKANLSLLGTPIWIGTIEELSNRSDLWSKYVYDCRIFGLFRNKIQIIIEDS